MNFVIERLKQWNLTEAHRQLFADQPATFASWNRHRSANRRYTPQPVIIFRVALGFFWHIILVVVIAVGLGLYIDHAVPRGAPDIFIPSGLQLFASTISFVLSLLLVFKTNSSFARWWEARTLWGRIVAYAWNTVRLAAATFPAHDVHLLRALVPWTIASIWACKDSVREDEDLRSELQGVLQPDELEWLLSHKNRCLAVSGVLSNLVEMASIGDLKKILLHEQINTFGYDMGGCERILNTPIPQAYERHTVRYLSICLLSLPLLLWGSGCGWSTPALAAIVSFLLLGIENIGAQIEEPFNVLPMTAGCMAVARTLTEMTEHAGREAAARASPVWLASPAVRLMQHQAAAGKAAVKTAATGYQHQIGLDAYTHHKCDANQHETIDASELV